MSNLIAALDIGTSKIAVLVGEVEAGELSVIGLGVHESQGIRRGMVVDIESCVRAVAGALSEAQKITDCEIHSVYMSITGSHINGHNSDGIVAIHGNEVTVADLERVIEAARAVVIPANQRILHALPQDYVIDNQDGIREPLGMSGVRLVAKVHVVTCATNAAQNLEKCVQRCSVEIDELVLSQLATSIAVLNEDEKELGVCLVDIGAGTMDIAIFVQGAIRHTAVIPIAGDHITQDIARTLRTPIKIAEEIKIRYACALSSLIETDDTLSIHSSGSSSNINEISQGTLSRGVLADIVQTRYTELFSLIYEELQRSGFAEHVSGVVLTGGTAKMEGTQQLADEIFQIPVRVGIPNIINGMDSVTQNPIYANAVGLLQYGMKLHDGKLENTEEPKEELITRFANWFKSTF